MSTESENEKSGERYAFFDLDHTLIPFDTQVLFCNHVLRREPWRILYLLICIPVIPLAALKLIRSRNLKRIFMSYLWRMPKERLEKHVSEFVGNTVDAWIYPEVRAELERHKKEGRTVILTTASPGMYGFAIGKLLGVDHTFATDVPIPERMPLIPDVIGANNKRGDKIIHMEKGGVLPEGFDPAKPYPIPDSYSYTDSPADLPLLAIAENGRLIHPGPVLAEEGEKNGWETLLPDRPYGSRAGNVWAMFRQMLGLYGKVNRPPSNSSQKEAK